MKQIKILIVDDEKLARKNILAQLDPNFLVLESATFEDANSKIKHHHFDICYIDLKLEDSADLQGLKIVELAVDRGIYTVVMTSIDDEAVAEMAYEYGCQDVYNKGNEKEHIAETINRYFLSRESFIEELLFKDILPTQNKKYKDDLKRLLKIIPSEIPICLLGESGTGKSHLARVIHQLSKRPGKFVELNCSTFSGDTLKSELFGHVKGSFTGANTDKIGKIAEANKGTLFLDEIGSMSLEMQEALLKVIEEKSFYPVGSNRLEKSDFRVVCATLDNLEELILSGKFRFDLFQRISGYTFTQPSLRNRTEDILPILKSKLSGSRKIIFKEDARKILQDYHWPGNIRELLRFAEVISYSSIGVVHARDVLEFIQSSSFKRGQEILSNYQFELIQKIGLRDFIEAVSREAIKKSLEKNSGKARKSIEELKISSATFYKYQERNELTFSMANKEEGVSYEIH